MNIKLIGGKRLGSTETFLKNIQNGIPLEKTLENVAEKTIKKLKVISPTKEISDGWDYEIEKHKNHITIYFNNNALSKNGENIVVLINNGYATKDGRWISGNNFIDYEIDKAYKEILEETMEELNRL